MSQTLAGLPFSHWSILWKETQAKMKQWHASAGPISSRRHRTETSALESPTPRFGWGEHQTQGCDVFTNRRIGKGIAV